MQSIHGDQNSVKFSLKEPDLAEYIPKSMYGNRRPDEWIGKFVREHSNHFGKTIAAARELYLKQLSKWTYFGTTIFHAKQTLSLNLPRDLWLGVSKTGIHIFQPHKKEPVISFAYQQILNWGPSSDSFFFMTGDLMKPQKFVFMTKQVRCSRIMKLIVTG